jgi:DNA topoisomerase III
VLERADPALVDPGVTAQMERLLDDVLVGQQEMAGAIDAVCAQPSRIIARLQDGAGTVDPALLGGRGGGGGAERPPTPAMKKFVDSLARQKGIKPPRGYTTSGALCRAFLDQHAPRKPAGLLGDGDGPDTSAADAGPAPARAPAKRKGVARRGKPAGAPTRARAKGKAGADAAGAAPHTASGDTPLKIPFGNKDAALQMGARYRAGGWYAPGGTDLDGFRARGWL